MTTDITLPRVRPVYTVPGRTDIMGTLRAYGARTRGNTLLHPDGSSCLINPNTRRAVVVRSSDDEDGVVDTLRRVFPNLKSA